MNPVTRAGEGRERRCVDRFASSPGTGTGTWALRPGGPTGAQSVLPGFPRASPINTERDWRLEARSKSRNKMPWIKSISPPAPAKFHQVPGAQNKGVSWGVGGGGEWDAGPADPLVGVRG